MASEKIIYTDGHDVVVTDSVLKVKNASYRLNGITKFYLWTIRPDRWPAIFLFLIGLLGITAGVMEIFSAGIKAGDGNISANTLALWIGIGLMLMGLFSLVFTKRRYAVRISTAEGEKNAVVSTQREYIAQIVDAIHSAFDKNNTPPVAMNKG